MIEFNNNWFGVLQDMGKFWTDVYNRCASGILRVLGHSQNPNSKIQYAIG